MAALCDWSDLLSDILGLFLDRLRFADHARFGAVCRSWHSAAAVRAHHRALHLPWILLPHCHHHVKPTLDLFSPVEGRIYALPLPLQPGSLCFGASHGWLLMTDRTHSNHLVNPFTRKLIPLPRANTRPFSKTILSSRPASDGDCVVVSIYGHQRLVFCRPGATWNVCHASHVINCFTDIIFSNGFLYALVDTWLLAVIEFQPGPRTKRIYRPILMKDNRPEIQRERFYLAESTSGDILMVIRNQNFLYTINSENGVEGKIPLMFTVSFEVFKLIPDGTEWAEVKSLGDETLFLGTGYSKCCKSVEALGIRPNCIYFTDDIYNEILVIDDCPVVNWGVFCLDDGSIQQNNPSGCSIFKGPILWFML